MKDRLYVGTVTKSAVEVAKEYGVGLEIDEFCTAENMDEERFAGVDKAVREKMKKCGADKRRRNGLPGVILHAPFNELFPAAIDKKVLAIAYERYNQAVQLAQSYGTNKMVVHSGFVPNIYFKEWHIDRSVEFWTNLMADKPKDFCIYIENVLEQEPYIMAELFQRLKEQPGTENIHMCIDVGHANNESDVDIVKWIKVNSKYIGHMHLHNNNGDWDYHQALNDGTMDMDKIIETLNVYCRPDITYTLETLPCRESLEWLVGRGYIRT